MYSQKANEQFEIYKSLIHKENRTAQEGETLAEAIIYLNQIPPAAAKELVYAFREMEMQRRQQANDHSE